MITGEAVIVRCLCGSGDLNEVAETRYKTWILECQKCKRLGHYDVAQGLVQWYFPEWMKNEDKEIADGMRSVWSHWQNGDRQS